MRICLFRRAHGVNHQFEQGADDAETGKFNVQYVARAVNLLQGDVCTVLVGIGRYFGYVVDEASFKFSFENPFFIVHKGLHALADKQPDNAGTQIGYLLIGVTYYLHGFEPVGLSLCGEVGEKQFFGLLRSQNFQFVGILDIHHLVADVIGCFHQIDQRVAGIFQRGVVLLLHTQFFCYAAETFFLCDEETEFGLLACKTR